MVKNLFSRKSLYVFWVAVPVLFAALYVLSRYNYLLFHSFIELFAVAIALSVFTVAWNTRHIAADNRLFLLAAACLSIGVIDTVHTLAYSGMGVFPDRGSDLATQLWIAARYVESLSFLAAALLFRTGRSFNDKMILAGYVVLTAGLLLMIIVLQFFPSMYVEGFGLTDAKVASEYVICAILAAAGYLFWSGRKQIGRLHMQFLLAAIGATIAGELSFTLYTDVYGFFNFLGHFFKLVSFWFIYKALVAGLLKDPFEGLFRELVQSRDRLRESESSLNAVFEQTIQLMGIIALDGTLMRANRTALEMIGANEKDVAGKPFWECPWWTHSGDLQKKLRRSMEKAKQGDSVRFEAVHMSADGQERVVDFSINPVYDDNGRVKWLLAESKDITERKQAEEELKESEKRFRLLVESAPEAIFVQAGGCFAYLNPAAVNLFGADSDEELLGQPVMERFHPDYHEMVKERIRLLNQEKKPVQYREEIYLQMDGSPVFVGVSAVPFKYRQKDGALVFVRDITEQKRADQKQKELEKQLELSQKLESVGRLAGGVAHDFNNLLSIILGYGEMVLENMEKHHPNYGPLTQIHDAGIRAKNLTRQLLAFGRKQVLEMQKVNVNDLISGFNKLLRRVIGEDVDLRLHLASEPLWIKADTSQVEQVLMNLAVNARDAMPEGGVLTIETAAVELDETYASAKPGVTPGTYALIAVSDTGIGMDQKTRDSIFEPFFTTKEKDKGTGLGLSTCYGIAKQHRGNIWVYSEPGAGTTFKIYFPLATKEGGKIEKQAIEKDIRLEGTETILVVEDDTAVRQLTCTVLKKSGYNVLDSEDVYNALGLSKNYEDSIHLMIVDVIMPGMKGPEVYRNVSAHHPETKVLYMSGYTDNVIAHQGILEEGIHFIQKPFSVKDLAAKVREVLD